MVRQAILFAAVASASAQMYGGYGPYGGPMGADVLPYEPEAPSPSADVMPLDYVMPMPSSDVMPLDYAMPSPSPSPSPSADVLPADLMPMEPEGDAAVLPAEPDAAVLPMSTLDGCFIDHGFGCEQCMQGFYKVGTAEAPTCAECTFDNCTFCNDFVGCAQCELGFFIVMGEDGYQECTTCAGDKEGFNLGCTPEQVAA